MRDELFVEELEEAEEAGDGAETRDSLDPASTNLADGATLHPDFQLGRGCTSPLPKCLTTDCGVVDAGER